LIPKKVGKTPLKTTIKQMDKNNIQIISNLSNAPVTPKCGYILTRES
jgi:hypothetical protein